MIERLTLNTPIVGIENSEIHEYWSWAHSDLLENTERGVFAEYLVALALGLVHVPRQNWLPYDLLYKEKIKIEVKSSAYIQSWQQKQHSKIIFNISRTRSWDPLTNMVANHKTRDADFYVFCVYKEEDRNKANVLNVLSWDFFILPTPVIEKIFPDRKTIGLSSLKLYCEATSFHDLKTTFDEFVSNHSL